MNSKCNVWYAVYNDFTDSFVTSLCSSLKDLQQEIVEEGFLEDVTETEDRCWVCKIEKVKNLYVTTKSVIVDKDGKEI